jgi:hypothetical protein
MGRRCCSGWELSGRWDLWKHDSVRIMDVLFNRDAVDITVSLVQS